MRQRADSTKGAAIQNFGQPFDISQPIWSESAAISGGGDGLSFGIRIGRWPSVGWAWVWAHVSIDGRFLGYNVDHHRCSAEVTDVHGGSVVYAATEIPCSLRRTGPRDGLAGASAEAELDFHDSREPPNTPGDTRIRIAARFEPGVMAGHANPGRLEARGTAHASITIGDRLVEVHDVAGHWHEQHQTAPRFRAPFTYVSLRGDDTALVATRSGEHVQGFAERAGETIRIVGAAIGPRGPLRDVRLELADGSTIAGTARLIDEHSVYIYGRRRPGTRVVLEGTDLSGAINDWDPAGRDPT